MGKASIRWKQFFHSSSSGFTLMELLVASSLSMLIMAMTVMIVLANNNLFKKDIARTSLNQNLRGAMDLISANIRQAGENLSATLPAVEVIDNGANPDELILRRNLTDEVLKLCVPIIAGTTNTNIIFATPGSIPGCVFTDNQHNFSAWQDFRTEAGRPTTAYLFNIATKQGDFFEYVSEVDNGTQLIVQRSAGTWGHSYTVGSGAIYLFEEWQFRVQNDLLQLIIDNDSANPLNVANDITNFQLQVHMQDGSTQSNFDDTDDWTQIESLEITLEGTTSFRQKALVRSITARFYPRNILSN